MESKLFADVYTLLMERWEKKRDIKRWKKNRILQKGKQRKNYTMNRRKAHWTARHNWQQKQIKSLINLNEFKSCTVIIMANGTNVKRMGKKSEWQKENAQKWKIKRAVLYFNSSTSSQAEFSFLLLIHCDAFRCNK